MSNTPAIYEIDTSTGRAVIDTGSRVVEVSYYWTPDDHGHADLDGSECLEIFDAEVAPVDASPLPGWDPACSAVQSLLTPAERETCEDLLSEWHREDEAGDGPEQDKFFPGPRVV